MSDMVPDPVEVLGLSSGNTSLQPSDDAGALIETILDELGSIEHNPDKSQTLRLFGYTGEPNDIPTLKSFLLTTLQAHRILAQRKFHSMPSEDQRTTDQLSRILKSLHVLPPAPPDSNLQELTTALNCANTALQDIIRNRQVDLPQPILSVEDREAILKNSHRKSLVENILQALQREHLTRVGMLLTRLNVTTQAFSRSDQAQADPSTFYGLSQNALQMQAQWRVPNPITMYQVLTTPHFVIRDAMWHRNRSDEISSASSHVKDFVMGAVPDRGGRLTASGGNQMPEFKRREDNNSISDRKSSANRSRHRKRSQKA